MWDVRTVRPRFEEREAERARQKEVRTRKVAERQRQGQDQESNDELSNVEAVEEDIVKKPNEEDKFVMVCRPKVGKMTIGGGFVGVWRKSTD